MNQSNRTLVKCLGLISIGCFAAFTLLVGALHFLRPQDNPFSQTVSAYAVKPDGFLMTIAFLLRALGSGCLVVGLAVGTTRSSWSWTGLIGLSLFAMCSVLVAIFPADPRAAPILFQLHSRSALLGFGSLALTAPVWAHRLRKAVHRRGDALAYVILGWLLLPSLVGFLVSPLRFMGLTERVLEVLMMTWLCFIAWQLSTFAFLNNSQRRQAYVSTTRRRSQLRFWINFIGIGIFTIATLTALIYYLGSYQYTAENHGQLEIAASMRTKVRLFPFQYTYM